jgi:TnpA family transposase
MPNSSIVLKQDTPLDYPNRQPVLTRPIKWELIRQQYDEMVKFATALRLGTAETEEILRRFTHNGVQHPTSAALLELGKVQRTLFLGHYLSSEELRREIQEGQSAHRELELGDQFYSLRSP